MTKAIRRQGVAEAIRGLTPDITIYVSRLGPVGDSIGAVLITCCGKQGLCAYE